MHATHFTSSAVALAHIFACNYEANLPPLHSMKAHVEVELQLHAFSSSTADHLQDPAALLSGKEPPRCVSNKGLGRPGAGLQFLKKKNVFANL